MSVPKNLAGSGVFLVTLCAATLLTGVLAIRTPRPAPITNATVTATSAAEIAHQVQLVMLDRENRRSHTKLTLVRDLRSRSPAPERVWVWTYFFTPNDMRTWASEPMEVREPFRDGDRVSVTVNSVCQWCDNAGTPTSGYYAGVHVSTSEEAAMLRADQLSLDIVRAAPVVVQAERR